MGNLVLFFPDVKRTFYAYGRKKVPLMVMIIAMIIMIVMMVILRIMKKNDNKTYKYYDFSAKMYQLKGLARKLATFFNGCLPLHTPVLPCLALLINWV